MALRVVGPVGGGTYKSGSFIAVLCAHVRRETLPPTQLGAAQALLRGDYEHRRATAAVSPL